jgi:hypothetical protein
MHLMHTLPHLNHHFTPLNRLFSLSKTPQFPLSFISPPP